MRRIDTRWLVAFGGSFLLLFIVGQVNHHLSNTPLLGRTVYLFVVGLPVAFAALRLGLGQGLATTVVTTMLVEAGLPVPEGSILLPAATCLCLTHAFRINFNRLDFSSSLTAALAINAVLMIVLTLMTGPFEDRAAWTRVAVDFALSQAVVAALTGWFFAAQVALLRVFGFYLDTELREAP